MLEPFWCFDFCFTISFGEVSNGVVSDAIKWLAGYVGHGR
jgi:hypothetical protein